MVAGRQLVASEEQLRWGGPIAPPTSDELADRYALGQLARVYALGVDMRDYGLARSVFADDAVVEGTGTSGAIDDYLPFIVESVSKFKATQHNITNQYISIEGGEAVVWSYAIAVHKVMPDADRPHFNLGVTYCDTCRRTADGWLIARRSVKFHWKQEYSKEAEA